MAPVSNPDNKSEEVTKHSVHTLVFRSQKRTHDMFISDQGALPPADPKAVDISRRIKARATYGAIMDTVERNKKRHIAAGIDPPSALALTHQGVAESNDTATLDGSEDSAATPNSELALYQAAPGAGAAGPTNMSGGGATSQVSKQ